MQDWWRPGHLLTEPQRGPGKVESDYGKIPKHRDVQKNGECCRHDKGCVLDYRLPWVIILRIWESCPEVHSGDWAIVPPGPMAQLHESDHQLRDHNTNFLC